MKVHKSYRGKRTLIEGAILSDISPRNRDGSIIIRPARWSGDRKRTRYEITIEATELRELRDACNKALGNITGHGYKTRVNVK